MTELVVQTQIAAPPAQCFDLARDVAFHARSLAHTGERVVSAPPHPLLELGDEVEFEGRHLGIRQRLRARITTLNRPFFFRDTMVRGAFRSFHHDHAFTPMLTGGTLMRDTLHFEAPGGPLAPLIERLVLRPYLQTLIMARGAALKAAAEAGAGVGAEAPVSGSGPAASVGVPAPVVPLLPTPELPAALPSAALPPAPVAAAGPAPELLRYSAEEAARLQAGFALTAAQYRQGINRLQQIGLVAVGSFGLTWLLPEGVQFVPFLLLPFCMVAGLVTAIRTLPLLRCPGCAHMLRQVKKGPYCPDCGSRQLVAGGWFKAPHCGSCGKDLLEGGKNSARNYKIRHCANCGLHLDEQGF